MLHADFLKLSENVGSEIDAVFLSPPWGGTGYQMLSEYNLEHIFPDFDLIVDKALTYSPNLMLFLPKNTSVTDLTLRLAKFAHRLIGSRRRLDLDKMEQPSRIPELQIEVERVMYGPNCKAVVVYTGDLARIPLKKLTKTFIDKFCTQHFDQHSSASSSVKSGHSSTGDHSTYQYMSQLITNVVQHAGLHRLNQWVAKPSKNRTTMQKVVKSL